MQQDAPASTPGIESSERKQAPQAIDGANVSPTARDSRLMGGGRDRQIRVGLIAVGLVIAGVVAVSQRNDVALDEISPGQCVQDPGDERLGEVEKVDCGQPHDMEVFAVVNIATGENEPWPGGGEIEDRSLDACLARVETYIGQDFWESPYDVTGISPVREGWNDGLHSTICLLINVDGSPLTGSLDVNS
jgi:hypothetical protein